MEDDSSLFWHTVRLLPYLLAGVLVCAACGRRQEPATERSAEPQEPRRQEPDARPVIVAFGDSLSEGHGVDAEQSYPTHLQRELDGRGYSYRVVNAGISGDTTSGGLERVDSVAAMRPAIVILELGANDGLRGIPVSVSQSNLDAMIVRLKKTGATVVLAGMTLPPNYGPVFIRSFERIFKELASRHGLPLIPFLLDGVAGTTRYMQPDGLHPTAEGNRIVAANVLKVLEPLLKKR